MGLWGFQSASVESLEGRSPWRREQQAEPVSAGGTPRSWRPVLEGGAAEIEAVHFDVVDQSLLPNKDRDRPEGGGLDPTAEEIGVVDQGYHEASK